MYFVKITTKEKVVTLETNGGNYFFSFYSCQRICDAIEKYKDGIKTEICILEKVKESNTCG